jgi:hypothetical protein
MEETKCMNEVDENEKDERGDDHGNVTIMSTYLIDYQLVIIWEGIKYLPTRIKNRATEPKGIRQGLGRDGIHFPHHKFF